MPSEALRYYELTAAEPRLTLELERLYEDYWLRLPFADRIRLIEETKIIENERKQHEYLNSFPSFRKAVENKTQEELDVITALIGP
jgi:hypothetical protein